MQEFHDREKVIMKKCRIIIQNFMKQLNKDNINAFAASTGFFFFLSLFPLLFVVCALIPYTPLTQENLIEWFLQFTPNSMDALVTELIIQSYHRTAKFLPLAILVAIWSAGKGMLGLIRGLNVVNEVDENRNYLQLRLEATIYVIVTIGALFMTLLVSVFGKGLILQIADRLSYGEELVSVLRSSISIFIWAFLIVVFSVVYTYVPNKKLKLNQQIPGAVFAAAGWQILSHIFSLYMENFVSDSIYGSFSTIIFFMVWLYFCIYVLLIGANLNRYFYPVILVLFGSRHKKKQGEKLPDE